ncbi:MAG: MarR family transcriptional regulator [Rhodospirillaceae bacterium]|nr:MarR family transcriptional regulator [Rhodospirillaceae bacterium]
MSNDKFPIDPQGRSAERTLDLLSAVSEDETISQRKLAARLGIALGLTNAVLKRCIRKGFLKIRQVPARRYTYYLTPKGFAEKSRLTAEYLSDSLQFYRQARQEYAEIFAYCRTRGWDRVAVVGATDLAEIASLARNGDEVDIVAILDPGRNEPAFFDIPVVQSLEGLSTESRPNAVIIADLDDPQAAYEKLCAFFPPDRVLAPPLMRLYKADTEGGQIEE